MIELKMTDYTCLWHLHNNWLLKSLITFDNWYVKLAKRDTELLKKKKQPTSTDHKQKRKLTATRV